MLRRTKMMALLLTALVVGGSALEAQALREWTLTGVLLGADGKPIPGATVRATQGPRTIVGRTNDKGVYRLTDMGEGTWTVAARSLGHVARAERITFDAKGMRQDFRLEAAAKSLDPVLVAANWSGVRGVVGDVRLLSPLADARISVIGGKDRTAKSNADGTFAVEGAPGTDIVLRVEREGYARQLITATVPAKGYIELDIPLDTLREEKRDQLAWEDLDRRLRFATPRAGYVSREEIESSDAIGLGAALTESGELASKGITLSSRTCLFVDGVARPGMPVDVVPAGSVEFVEVYPSGSDLTNTLSLRWPPRGECGGAGGNTRAATGRQVVAGSRRSIDPQAAQYVVVWTRAQ